MIQLCQAWRNSYLQIIYVICAAGSAVYIVRCYDRVNQLHESGRGVDLSSNTCSCKWLIRRYFTVLIGILKEIRAGTSVRKCKGMRECLPTFFLPFRARKNCSFWHGCLNKCRRFRRLFHSRIGSLSDGWNRFLCLCRRPCIRILFRCDSSPGGLPHSSAACSCYGCPRFTSFRCRL